MNPTVNKADPFLSDRPVVPPGQPLIEVEDLHKSFGSLHVLRGITTTIRKGEVVVVIGPSGGGKSTFLRCLNLLETPTSGRIWFGTAPASATSTATAPTWGWCSSASTSSRT